MTFLVASTQFKCKQVKEGGACGRKKAETNKEESGRATGNEAAEPTCEACDYGDEEPRITLNTRKDPRAESGNFLAALSDLEQKATEKTENTKCPFWKPTGLNYLDGPD